MNWRAVDLVDQARAIVARQYEKNAHFLRLLDAKDTDGLREFVDGKINGMTHIQLLELMEDLK